MSIKENLNEIKKSISKNITLVAVSKTKPIEDINIAYKLGQRDFGENKVQELLYKEEVLPDDIRWHFIGNLQTNKVKYLVDKVYLIHSLSSMKLLKKIEDEFSKKNSIANLLIQINIGKEESKGGFLKEDL
ncbi:MAG: YggS family pyridoxal phosphate-dependent enzyme, partial [Clostridium sp.]